MNPALLIGLLWLAVVWRLWITLREDASTERRSLTLALVFFAATATIWVYRREINVAFAVPNVSTLLVRWALGLCWIVAQPFVVRLLHARLRPGRRRPGRQWVVLTTAVMIVACTTLWAVAPIHHVELETLDAAPDIWTTLFVVISYVWVLVMLGELTVASVRAYTAMAGDAPGRASAIFLGVTGVVGSVGIVLLALERVLHIGSHSPSTFGVVGAGLMPVTAATAAAGMLSVPVLESFHEQVDARRQIRSLRPQWLRVRHEHPEVIVHLPLWSRLVDAPLVAERMRIEILDASHAAKP